MRACGEPLDKCDRPVTERREGAGRVITRTAREAASRARVTEPATSPPPRTRDSSSPKGPSIAKRLSAEESARRSEMRLDAPMPVPAAFAAPIHAPVRGEGASLPALEAAA